MNKKREKSHNLVECGVGHRRGEACSGWPSSIHLDKIHMITPEDHTRDVVCRGWLFSNITQLYTVTLHNHTMGASIVLSVPRTVGVRGFASYRTLLSLKIQFGGGYLKVM